MLYDWSMESNCYTGILGSKNSVVCAREGGANTTPYILAAHFAKRNTKFRGGKARAGKNSFPPTPFLFARPSVRFRSCRAKRGNQSGFCSKKVRAAFSNCDNKKASLRCREAFLLSGCPDLNRD